MELLKAKVLVVNTRWQRIRETDVQTAVCDLVRGACTAIDTETMRPLAWNDWLQLPVREGDRSIRAVNFVVRVPTVICNVSYAKMPKRRPKWSKRGVAKRDGFVCQITGKFAPDGNVDHVLPRSRGGTDSWDNTVWTAKDVNTKKADRTLPELGWQLLRQPSAPKELPMVRLIPPRHSDWLPFLQLDKSC